MKLWLFLLAMFLTVLPASAALDPVTNFAVTTLASGIDNSTTTIVVATGTGGKFPGTYSYPVVIYNCTDYGSAAQDPQVEIVLVTNRASDTFTVTRGQEGTSAANHNTGGKTYCMELTLTKGMWDRLGTYISTQAGGGLAAGEYDCSNYASCNEAVSTIVATGASRATLRVSNFQTIATNLTIPGHITVERTGGGAFSIDPSVTLTFDRPEQIRADWRNQLFYFAGAGTGRVAWSNPGTVPITWCGAIAGDTIDDSTAAGQCQVGFPTVTGTESAILEIPPGTYIWNSQITLSSSNLVVRMTGAYLNATQIAGTGQTNVHATNPVLAAFKLSSARQRIVGGRIFGSNSYGTNNLVGILMDGATSPRASSVMIENMYVGIWLGNNVTDARLANIETNNCGYGVMSGFAVSTLSNPQVTRGVFQMLNLHNSSIGAGLLIESHSRDIEVLGGHFTSNAGDGIRVEYGGERVQIIGTNLRQNSGRGLRIQYSTLTGDSAGQFGYGRRSVIANNIAGGNTLDNYSIEVVDYSAFSAIGGVEEIEITGNYSEGSSNYGFRINCVRCTIANNVAVRNTQAAFWFGSLQDASIMGNQAWDSGTTSTHHVNYIFQLADTTGSTPPNSTRVTFVGNVGGDTRSGGNRTVDINFSIAQLVSNSIFNGNIGSNAVLNDWEGMASTTGLAFWENQGTVSAGNSIGAQVLKHLSSTTTYDPPNIVNGDYAMTTLTVTGASVGDPAVCSHTTLGANRFMVSCHVDQADRVRVIIYNGSGGDLDPVSGTLRADVWKH